MSRSAREAPRSRRRGVGRRHVAIMAMAAMGPAVAIALDFPAMSAAAGPAFVLSLLITLAAVACVASAVRELARWYPHPGTFYAWGSHAFGARSGFLLGWVLLGAYLAVAAGGLLLFGGWGEAWLSSYGLPVPWWAWSTAALGYVTVITVRGLAASVRGMSVLLTFQVLVVAVVAVVAFTAAPSSGYEPRELVGGAGWPGVPLAMAAGILACVGFEQAATLAEETERPREDLPRAVFAGAVLVPAFYVAVAAALVVGLGPRAVTGSVPLQDTASAYLGPAGSSLVVAAGLGSALALTQAVFGAAARLVRAMARDRRLPRALAVTHPDFGTPYAATLAVAVVSLVVGWGLAMAIEPLRLWADLGLTFSLLFLVAYLVVNVAVMVCARRQHPAERSTLRHLAVPAAAIIAVGYALYERSWPLSGARGSFGVVAGVWIVLGVTLLVVRRRGADTAGAPDPRGESTLPEIRRPAGSVAHMEGDHHDNFREYVLARSGALLRTAYLLTGHRADAEDLLQTALAKTYLAWGRIHDKGSVDAYVRRAMVNTHVSWWRRRKVDTYATETVPEQPSVDPSEHTVLHEAMWTALGRLPRRQRAVVVLRYYEDLTEAEIADVLGVSVGTVKSTLSRGVAKLRRDVGLRDDVGLSGAPTESPS